MFMCDSLESVFELGWSSGSVSFTNDTYDTSITVLLNIGVEAFSQARVKKGTLG